MSKSKHSEAQIIAALKQVDAGRTAGHIAELSEEVLARMMMLVQIRTALYICWLAPLANEWIGLPNIGDPYRGLSPVPMSPNMAGSIVLAPEVLLLLLVPTSRPQK